MGVIAKSTLVKFWRSRNMRIRFCHAPEAYEHKHFPIGLVDPVEVGSSIGLAWRFGTSVQV